MRGYNRHCVAVSGTTDIEIWKEVRSQLGQLDVESVGAVSIMTAEINDYNAWVIANGPVPFDKWLIWLIRIGTTNCGNLPTNKIHDGKVGYCYAPCPYSTQSSDVRTRHLLHLGIGDPLPTKVDHEQTGITYYMKTAARGNKWGFECTYIGCTHYILTGENYFYT